MSEEHKIPHTSWCDFPSYSTLKWQWMSRKLRVKLPYLNFWYWNSTKLVDKMPKVRQIHHWKHVKWWWLFKFLTSAGYIPDLIPVQNGQLTITTWYIRLMKTVTWPVTLLPRKEHPLHEEGGVGPTAGINTVRRKKCNVVQHFVTVWLPSWLWNVLMPRPRFLKHCN